MSFHCVEFLDFLPNIETQNKMLNNYNKLYNRILRQLCIYPQCLLFSMRNVKICCQNRQEMFREGVLGPAESALYIADNAKHVHIYEEGLERLCDEIMSSLKDGKLEIPEIGGDEIHPSKDHPRAVDWIFVCDALNFCFWSVSEEKKWTVNGYTGYYALEAALSRALKEGTDITNPNFYSKITEEQLRHIMRGDNEISIPLFEERLRILHEVGKTLIEKFHGTFEECVKQANKSALKLIEIIVNNFNCFVDEGTYPEGFLQSKEGKKVSFYKRAQILVADLWNFFGGEKWGEFDEIDRLTMFADYRVPQVLVYFGVLVYSDDLTWLIKKGAGSIKNGSDLEMEIRGCSIHAVELLKKKIEERIKEKTEKVEVPNSVLIDYYLWCYRRKHSKEIDTVPFHKTYCIYY